MPVKKPCIEHKRNASNPILFDNRSKKRPFTIKIIFLKRKAVRHPRSDGIYFHSLFQYSCWSFKTNIIIYKLLRILNAHKVLITWQVKFKFSTINLLEFLSLCKHMYCVLFPSTLANAIAAFSFSICQPFWHVVRYQDSRGRGVVGK